MNYETSQPFRGQASKAIDFLIQVLTPWQFRVESRTDDSLIMTCPGVFRPKRSILIAQRIEFKIASGAISAKSQSPSVRAYLSIAIVLFAILGGVSVATIKIRVHPPHALPAWQWMSLAPLVGVAIGLPLIPVILKKQHRCQVDRLLRNAAAMGGGST